MAKPRKSRLIDPHGCSAYERRFVELFLISRNATEAYSQLRRGKITTNSARKGGMDYMASPQVQAALRAALQEVHDLAIRQTNIRGEAILKQYELMAQADPREMVQVQVRSCRYCHGKDHKYQFTVSEMGQRREKWEKGRKKVLSLVPGKAVEFDELGGTGYNPVKNPPHPDCPECFGEGEATLKVSGTSSLSPAAARLFAGAKMGRNGIELKFHSVPHALDRLGEADKLWKGEGGDEPEGVEEFVDGVRGALDAMDNTFGGDGADPVPV